MEHNCILGMTERIAHGHVYIEEKGLGLYRAQSLIDTGLAAHGFSTRRGGVSGAPYESLNLSLSRPDLIENIHKNYTLFADTWGFELASVAIVSYEHGNHVMVVDGTKRGCGLMGENKLPPCDGIITNDPDVTLLTLHADCGAIYFADPKKRAVGLLHAGWRGTLTRIGTKLIEAMQAAFESDPQDIIVAMGPCICGNCYEVDEGIANKFIKEFSTDSMIKRKNKPHVDLALCVAIQLMECGVLPEHMTIMGDCTFENREHFFSYRRDKGQTGAMAAFIKLTNL